MGLKQIFKKKRFLLYVWIGVAFCTLWILSNLDDHATAGARSINDIWRAIYIVIVNYILLEYAIPRMSFRKIFRSILLVIVFIFIFTFGLYLWRFIGILLHIWTPMREFATVEEGVGYGAPYSVASIIFFTVITHVYDYRKLKISAQQLKIEKQQAELNYLKAQTNPHFLFNTLNNIYALSRDKSDLAPESILRLSKILRFMLYETTGKFIPIEQELKIINDYIELEKLRYDETLKVNFHYEVKDMSQPVPPLLLIPLVENAFKHGVSETRNKPFVDINLQLDKNELEFFVRNSTEPYPENWKVKENIGLSNLRRQLELLYRDYKLSVEQRDAVFIAALRINLTSHV